MNEETVKQAIAELKPELDAKWEALQAFEQSIEYVNLIMTHEKLLSDWSALYVKNNGLLALLHKP